MICRAPPIRAPCTMASPTPPQRLALLRQARWRRVRTCDEAADAEVGMAGKALRTAAAKPGEARHHVIAGAQRRDVGADRLHDAGTLVAEHDGAIERPAALAVDHVQVAVADAGGRRAYQDLAARRLVDLDGLDRERLVRLAKDRGLHLHAGLLTVAASTRSSRRRPAPSPAPGRGPSTTAARA